MYLCTSSTCNQLSQAQTFRIRFILLTTTYWTSDGFNLAGHFSEMQQYVPSCGTKSVGQWSLTSQCQQTSRLPWSPPGSCCRRGLWSPWGHQQQSGASTKPYTPPILHFQSYTFQSYTFQSSTLPILHPSNLSFFQSYTLPILHTSNPTLFQSYTLSHFQSYTLPILHSSNLTPFQSYTLPILHPSNPTPF